MPILVSALRYRQTAQTFDKWAELRDHITTVHSVFTSEASIFDPSLPNKPQDGPSCSYVI